MRSPDHGMSQGYTPWFVLHIPRPLLPASPLSVTLPRAPDGLAGRFVVLGVDFMHYAVRYVTQPNPVQLSAVLSRKWSVAGLSGPLLWSGCGLALRVAAPHP